MYCRYDKCDNNTVDDLHVCRYIIIINNNNNNNNNYNYNNNNNNGVHEETLYARHAWN